MSCIWLDTLPSVSCEAQLDISSGHLDDKKKEEEDNKVIFIFIYFILYYLWYKSIILLLIFYLSHLFIVPFLSFSTFFGIIIEYIVIPFCLLLGH